MKEKNIKSFIEDDLECSSSDDDDSEKEKEEEYLKNILRNQ